MDERPRTAWGEPTFPDDPIVAMGPATIINWRTKNSFVLALISASLTRQNLGPVDTRLILGWLLEEHGQLLEGLPAHAIDADVRTAVAAINADPRTSAQVALDHGLSLPY